jgi:hypothetical protein
MAIIDYNLQMCSATSIVLSTGTNLVGSQIDLSTTSRDIGLGRPLFVVVRVDTSVAATGGASTVQFVVASDDSASIATNGTATVLGQTAAIAKASLTAGTTLVIPIAPTPSERYVGILAVIASNDVTTGKIDAWLTDDIQKYTALPDALSAP